MTGPWAAALFAALAGMPLTAAAAEVVFLGATVIDGTGGAPIADAQVVVSGARIVAIGPRRAAPPPGARAIDVTGKWIIPGLVDAHVHFFQSGGLYARPDIIDLTARRPYAEETAGVRERLDETLARYLASGVTAVVDMGGPMWNFTVRERARRTPMAPRVAVAGPLLATFAPPQLAGDDPSIVRIRNAAEARAEVRRQLALGPDLIKIWFVFPGPDIEPEMAWVRAAIDEAHAGGTRVVAHATQRRVARAVVTAGVDILAHGIDDGPDRRRPTGADQGPGRDLHDDLGRPWRLCPGPEPRRAVERDRTPPRRSPGHRQLRRSGAAAAARGGGAFRSGGGDITWDGCGRRESPSPPDRTPATSAPFTARPCIGNWR